MTFKNQQLLAYILYTMSMLILLSCSKKTTPLESINIPNPLHEDYYQSRIVSIIQKDRELITGHENGAITVWPYGLDNDYPTHSWLAHEGPIRNLMITDDQHLLSLSADGSWAKWSKKMAMLQRHRLIGSQANVLLVISPELHILGDAHGTVNAIHRGQRMWRTAGEHGRAVFGLERLNQTQIISVGSDGCARCWFIESGQNCGILSLHQGWITNLKPFGPRWLTGGSDGYIKVWSERLVDQLNQSIKGNTVRETIHVLAQYRAHQIDLTSLDTANQWIISGSEEGSITLLKYDPKNRRLVHHWSVKNVEFKPVTAVKLDLMHNRALVAGGKGANLWFLSLDDGQLQRSLR